MRKFKTFDGEVFDTFQEALDWLRQYDIPAPEDHIRVLEDDAAEDLSTESLTETQSSIEENPEEDPDEESAIDEETLELIANHENLTKTEKEVLFQML